MEKAKGDFQTLYQRKKPHPPGLSLDTHVNSDEVNDEVLSYAEVEAAVRRLPPHRAGGHINLRVEHFKQWQREAYPGEN